MNATINRRLLLALITGLVVYSSATACTRSKSTDLERARVHLKKVTQKLMNMNAGAWIPVPQGVFMPSIDSTFKDLDAMGYAPPSSKADDLVASAKTYMKASDYNKALSVFLEASRLDEDNPEPYFWAGLLFPATGGPPEVAELSLGEAISKDLSQKHLMAIFALRQRGVMNLMIKDGDSSLNDFSECIRLSGDQQETAPLFWQVVYLDRGVAFQNLGKTQEALQDYQKALDLAALEEHPVVVEKIQELVDEIDKAIK